MMPSRFIHVTAGVRLAFRLEAEQDSAVCVDGPHCVRPRLRWRASGLLPHCSSASDAALHVGVQTPV